VQAWFLATELARRGYDVHYICQSVVPTKVGQTERLQCVNIHWLRPSGRFLWLDVGKYFRVLINIMPDIVIQRLSYCVTGTIGRFCRRYKKPFIWICTDDMSPNPWLSCSKLRAMCRNASISWAKHLVFLANAIICDLMRQRGLRCVTQAFVLNDFQGKELLRRCGIKPKRMISGHPIPNYTLPPRKKIDQAIVLWAGNLGYNKSPKTFIELAHDCLHTNLRFVMIGGGLSDERVQELFKSIPSNLEWKGRLPFKETIQYFDMATFLVNTSISEGFPNTFIQAWLRGVPILSIGVDPNQVVTKNRLGYVATYLGDLEREMLRLINSPEEYIELSRNAKTYAEQHHTVEAMTDKFLGILQSADILRHQGNL